MITYSTKTTARRVARAAGLDPKCVQPAGPRRFRIDPTDTDLEELRYRYNGMAKELASLGDTRHKINNWRFVDLDQALAFCDSAASTLRAIKDANAAYNAQHRRRA